MYFNLTFILILFLFSEKIINLTHNLIFFGGSKSEINSFIIKLDQMPPKYSSITKYKTIFSVILEKICIS